MTVDTGLDFQALKAFLNLAEDASEEETFAAAHCCYHQCQPHITRDHAPKYYADYLVTGKPPFYVRRLIDEIREKAVQDTI